MYQSLNRALESASQRSASANLALASGKKFQKVSEAPSDATQMLRLQSDASAISAYQRSAEDANSWLATADSSLQDVVNIYNRVEELGLNSVNSSLGADELNALADEIDGGTIDQGRGGLMGQLASALNTTYLGQAIFAGHDTSAVSSSVQSYIDSNGNPATYTQWSATGQSGPVLRQIDSATQLDVSVDGPSVISPDGGADAFTTLRNLATAIRSRATVPATDRTVPDLTARVSDVLRSSVLSQLEQVGAKTNELDMVRSRLTTLSTNNENARASIGQVDFAKAALDVQSAQTAYQAALSAISKATMKTLADFM